jgi:hypothetical protein
MGVISTIDEVQALPYKWDNIKTSKRIMLRKICEVTSFLPMFLEGRHTATFMPRNKQSVVHQSLCLKQSLELKSFLVSQ